MVAIKLVGQSDHRCIDCRKKSVIKFQHYFQNDSLS